MTKDELLVQYNVFIEMSKGSSDGRHLFSAFMEKIRFTHLAHEIKFMINFGFIE